MVYSEKCITKTFTEDSNLNSSFKQVIQIIRFGSVPLNRSAVIWINFIYNKSSRHGSQFR